MRRKFITALLGALICVLVVSIIMNMIPSEEGTNYQVEEIRVKSPYLFNGISEPERLAEFYMDISLGELKDILFEDGKEVNENDVIATYQRTIDEESSIVTANVVAPFKGSIFVNMDGIFNNTMPYALVVSTETVIKGTITEYDYSNIEEGQVVDLLLTEENKTMKGTIIKINALPDSYFERDLVSSNNGTSTTYSFYVKPKEYIQYGYNVQVVIVNNDIELPKSAVVVENDKRYVFLYNNQNIIRREVELKENKETYTVKEGLKENDQIILNPEDVLQNK